MHSVAPVDNLHGGWNVALAVFSLVLIAGGITAIIKKVLRSAHALTILATAVVVGGVALLANGFPIAPLKVAIIVTSTIGGIAIAIAVITSPAGKPRARDGPHQ
jgi:hypothetical protein